MNARSNDGERADCSVRSVAAAFGITYADAHDKLKSLGRKNRCGVHFRKLIVPLGLEQVPELSGRRIESILPEMQSGRFIVRIRRHAFAVVDGVIHDNRQPPLGSVVKMAYRIPTLTGQ